MALMEFGTTYIFLFGFKLFEPMVLLTNIIFFVFCTLFFIRLKDYRHQYAKQMSGFIFSLGISSAFGAVGHAVQLQLGEIFFKIILFSMNALSLLAIYYCFRAAYTYTNLNKRISKKYIYFVVAWIFVLLVACGFHGNFLLIKIHAGIVLLYSLIAHYIIYKKTDDKGSERIVLGILISFLPIIVHTLKFSFSEWYNYKDIAHTIMILSLIVIYSGAKKVSEELQGFSEEISVPRTIEI